MLSCKREPDFCGFASPELCGTSLRNWHTLNILGGSVWLSIAGVKGVASGFIEVSFAFSFFSDPIYLELGSFEALKDSPGSLFFETVVCIVGLVEKVAIVVADVGLGKSATLLTGFGCSRAAKVTLARAVLLVAGQDKL